MWIYYVLFCVIVVLFIVFFSIYVINKSKFQVLIIKINEAENNINELLNKKYAILVEIGKFIKKKTKETTFDGLENINIEEISHFELSKELAKYDHTIVEYVEFNKNIKFTEKELSSFDEFTTINIEYIAAEKYYNDNASIFNKLINTFPASLVSKIKRYKEKEFYSNEKEEIFEILKK